MSDVTLHLGDCLEVMRSMPDKSVDAVLDAADGDEDIARIAKHLQTAVKERRCKTSRFGVESALELLAALGVWLGEHKECHR